MPGIIFDDTLTDAGESIMGGTRVYFVAWEVLTMGPIVRQGSSWDVNSLLGVGHYELGNDLTPGGSISGIAYGEAQWLNNPLGQRVVSPGQVGSDFASEIQQYIRWALSPGTEVHLYVFGDS